MFCISVYIESLDRYSRSPLGSMLQVPRYCDRRVKPETPNMMATALAELG
jgi:hypothetical protein